MIECHGGDSGFLVNNSTEYTASAGAYSGGRQQHTSLVPVTIRQIQLAQVDTEDYFLIDMQNVSQVRVIGQILSVPFATSNLTHTYIIDDGTAKIDVRVWLHEDADGVLDYHASKKHEWREGVYVVVYGSIKLNANKRSIVASRMKTITDYNEIAHHFIQIIYVHLYNTKKAAGTLDAGNASSAASKKDSYEQYANPYKIQKHSNRQTEDEQLCGETEKKIISLCKNSPQHGISIKQLCDACPNVTQKEMETTLDNLSRVGLVFSTITNHWKAE
ncbi:uncharacterized protein LOC126325908 [Schistocerca gregaria]|uniref:uncharacterized protein LOC126325908 n=1 Tax=Schistocerca gregaria TaxID=7010 RepID=UPI00211ECD26|nr:uncharacterized protein LOC126325908 [Schistocerca gregaria]